MIDFNEYEWVEYQKGHVIEDIKQEDSNPARYSFADTAFTKYGAIGIVSSLVLDSHSCPWIYKVKIIWNNGKKLEEPYYVGANNVNLRRLTKEETIKWQNYLLKSDGCPNCKSTELKVHNTVGGHIIDCTDCGYLFKHEWDRFGNSQPVMRLED